MKKKPTREEIVLGHLEKKGSIDFFKCLDIGGGKRLEGAIYYLRQNPVFQSLVKTRMHKNKNNKNGKPYASYFLLKNSCKVCREKFVCEHRHEKCQRKIERLEKEKRKEKRKQRKLF